MELNVPWTAQASKHCWDTSPVKEPPTKQLSQVLSFRTRQLGVLIHLFCSAVPSHMFLLGCCLFCAASSSLCHSSQGCSSHAVCDTPYLQCSGAQGEKATPGSESTSFLAGQAGAQHTDQCQAGNGRVPRSWSLGQDGEFVSKITLSEFPMPCPTLSAHLNSVPSLE